MASTDRELGMTRDITRRDFINGTAVAITGALAAPGVVLGRDVEARSSPQPAEYYPPTLTGMRGSHPGSFEVAHGLRDGRAQAGAAPTGERYDLVVVGGGISGLSAAHFHRAAAGRSSTVLVLDNHDDFGGHAKRNEHVIDGRTLVLNGGTLNIEAPQQYSAVAMGLLKTIGIDIDRFERTTEAGRNLYRTMNLGTGVWFNKEKWGTDRLVAGQGRLPWPEFLAKTPLSDAAQRDVLRLMDAGQPDYMPGLTSDEKKQKLLRMSYQAFLLDVAKVHPDVVWLYQARSTGLFLMMIDALPAYYAWNMRYPGFQGLKLDPTPDDVLVNEPGGAHGRENQDRADRGGRSVHFPDGNATIARLLVRSLLPDAVPGTTQEDVVTSRVDYAKLDRPGSAARIRLNSTVVNVSHVGDPATSKEVVVTYVKDGRTHSVRAGAAVMACWNSFVPYLVPDLPAAQKEALLYGIKAPIVYTNVFIRNWTSFAKLGVSNINAPGGYHHSVQLSESVSIGDYRHARTPEEPIVLHLVKTPCAPGKPRKEQHRLGRAELLQTSFETFERNIRDQLGRSLSDGGFDPARDISAITVNRWPHGYTYNYNTLADPIEWAIATPDDRPCVVGRKTFGRIAIANADAAGSSHTDAAIEQAHRAVGESLGSRVPTSAG
ncbi:MAG: NAD(P)-binding protein [Vicinamibacterales bacterium]